MYLNSVLLELRWIWKYLNWLFWKYYHSFLMPDWFVFSDSPQTFLDCCPFPGPTEALVEAVLSFSSVFFPGYSNLFPVYLSSYRYCCRCCYRFFWRHWFFCQESDHRSYLRSTVRQQKTLEESQKVTCLLVNPCNIHEEYLCADFSFI